MLELVMTVCLMNAPAECRRERMPFDGPLMACAMGGQFAAADWLATHPKWRLERWHCGQPSRDA